MGKKRGNGEGSISQRQSDGIWQASMTLPNGKRKYLYGKTRQIVARKLAAATRDRDHGLPLVTDERLTVERYLTQWLERMQPPRIRASTHLRYTSLLSHVIRAHGPLRLTHLTAQHLSTLYARLQQAEVNGGAGLSASTVHHVHTVLHGALDDALKLDLIPINVTERVDAPKLRSAVVDPYTREEANQLLEAARGDRLEALYALAITTGMRLGELLALSWRQVDVTATIGASLRVVATTQRDANGAWTIGEPKTYASRRQIGLTPVATRALLRHQARQRAEQEAQSNTGINRPMRYGDLVFTDTVGGLLDEGNVSKRSYMPLLQRAGLPYRRFHTLRHTCATLLLADGVSLHKVSALLGHASISITADLYGHLAKSDYQQDTSESMARLIRLSDDADASQDIAG